MKRGAVLRDAVARDAVTRGPVGSPVDSGAWSTPVAERCIRCSTSLLCLGSWWLPPLETAVASSVALGAHTRLVAVQRVVGRLKRGEPTRLPASGVFVKGL